MPEDCQYYRNLWHELTGPIKFVVTTAYVCQFITQLYSYSQTNRPEDGHMSGRNMSLTLIQ